MGILDMYLSGHFFYSPISLLAVPGLLDKFHNISTGIAIGEHVNLIKPTRPCVHFSTLITVCSATHSLYIALQVVLLPNQPHFAHDFQRTWNYKSLKFVIETHRSKVALP